MDYLKKSVKTGKALYTAVDGAIRNPDQFLTHGQHNQQQPHGQQQQYYQQQIPQAQYNPHQPPPYPPRPGAQPISSPAYNNGSQQSVSYQQQPTGYTPNPQLPPRPQTVGPYPQMSQSIHQQYQQGTTQANEQFTGHIPATQPTSSQPAWQPNQQIPQQLFSPVQQPSQPVFSPVQQPLQPIFSPVQSFLPCSPPPVGAYNQLSSPVQPVSPMTTSATPVSQPFSPPLPAATPGIPSPQLGTNTHSFPAHNTQFQGHITPPPFGSHAGHAINPYHAPSATPSSGPIVAPPSQTPHLPNPYTQSSSGSQQTSFIAELPEDNFANQPVELPAELPGDFLSSKPAEHNSRTENVSHASTNPMHTTGTSMTTMPGKSVDELQTSIPGHLGSSKDKPVSVGGETPIIPLSTVTPNERIQQPTPLHSQASPMSTAQTTPPSTQWQPHVPSPTPVYNPCTFPSMPGSGPSSPHSHSVPFQQTHAVANSSGYIAYSQPQQPARYQQPQPGNSDYIAYGQRQQQPVTQAPCSNSPVYATYGQPAPLQRMGSLAEKAQQMSLNNQSGGPSAQYPYRALGPEDRKLAQSPVQQQSFGQSPGHSTVYSEQSQPLQVPINPNAPGYHPHGPPPSYIQ